MSLCSILVSALVSLPDTVANFFAFRLAIQRIEEFLLLRESTTDDSSGDSYYS